MSRERFGLIVYWSATVVAAALFAVPGGALLARDHHFAAEMARLGYPAYFLLPFGVLKILGAVVILLPGMPRAKEWAYAGMGFDVIFAVYSRAALGDALPEALFPLIIGGVACLSWAMRPAARKF
jgi:uncharacterized membrane protein YphA (DoxX/SURF4 family)